VKSKDLRGNSHRSPHATLDNEALKTFLALKKTKQKIVFAESCTAGLLASSLAPYPGVSQFLGGSMVVYQEAMKTRWLGVSKKLLNKHTAVSEECVKAMLHGVLRKSPEADLAVATSGYLGPGNSEDGLVYVGFQWRNDPSPHIIQLRLYPDVRRTTSSLREKRRLLASTLVLFLVRSLLTHRFL
jgi:nicotinamide-nucleotide amidase